MKDNEYYSAPRPDYERPTLQSSTPTSPTQSSRALTEQQQKKRKRRQKKQLQEGMSKSTGLLIGAVACVMLGTAVPEPTTPIVEPVEEFAEITAYQPNWNEDWAGVWEADNGDYLIMRCINDDDGAFESLDADYIDTTYGGDFSLGASQANESMTELYGGISDNYHNYDASYDYVLISTDTFAFTHVVNGQTICENRAFSRIYTPSDGADPTWSNYFE